MRFRVYFEDTDAMGIVYHANYLRFCERARSEAFFRSNMTHELAGNGGFVLARCECDFLLPARLGDEILVRTKLLKLRRASVWLSQEIELASRANATSCELGARLFSAQVKLAYINAQGAAAAIPKRVLEILEQI